MSCVDVTLVSDTLATEFTADTVEIAITCDATATESATPPD